MILERKEGETEIQYLWRIGKMVDAGKIGSWKDITPALNKQLREDDEYYDDVEDEDTGRFSKKSSGKIKSVPRGDRKMEIVVLKPTNFDTDSRKITEHLKYNRTVMIDLEGITIDLAQRIVDYASGSSNAIEGDFSIVSKNFVIVSPPAVSVMGDVVSSNSDSGAVNIME